MTTKMFKNDNIKIACAVIILLLVAILSFTVVADWVQKPQLHKNQMKILDEKKETVLKLTAVTTATSTLITVLPGDMATPIAEKLADVSGYLVIVLCAIFLEKYLLVITGVAVCKVMVPLLCLLLGIRIFINKEVLDKIILKLALFSVAICLVIRQRLAFDILGSNRDDKEKDALPDVPAVLFRTPSRISDGMSPSSLILARAPLGESASTVPFLDLPDLSTAVY